MTTAYIPENRSCCGWVLRFNSGFLALTSIVISSSDVYITIPRKFMAGDIHICLLIERNYLESADAFGSESGVASRPANDGNTHWWSVYWDIHSWFLNGWNNPNNGAARNAPTMETSSGSRLDTYIYAYLIEHNYLRSTKVFGNEADIPSRPDYDDYTGWWSVFSEIRSWCSNRQKNTDNVGSRRYRSPSSSPSYHLRNANNNGPYSAVTASTSARPRYDNNGGSSSYMATLDSALTPLSLRELEEIVDVAEILLSLAISNPPDSNSSDLS